MTVVKRKGLVHRMVTENAVNRRNCSEEDFRQSVQHDSVYTDYPGYIVYLQGARPVAYYVPASRNAYIAVKGLPNIFD